MKLLALAGFALIGMAMTLRRQSRLRAPVAVALRSAGMVLVAAGLYLGVPANP